MWFQNCILYAFCLWQLLNENHFASEYIFLLFPQVIWILSLEVFILDYILPTHYDFFFLTFHIAFTHNCDILLPSLYILSILIHTMLKHVYIVLRKFSNVYMYYYIDIPTNIIENIYIVILHPVACSSVKIHRNY